MGRKKASSTDSSGCSELVKKSPCNIKKIAESPTKVTRGGRVSTKSRTITPKHFFAEVPKQNGRPKPQATASAKLKQPYANKSIDKILDFCSLNNNNNNNNNFNEKVIKKEKEVTKVLPTDDDPKIPLPNQSDNIPKIILPASKSPSPSKEGNQLKGSEFKCKVCQKWFPNRYFQRKHMLMEHEDQLYECRVCSFNSVDPEKLKSHIIKLHVTKKEKSESVSLDSLQDELEKLIDKKVPRKVMMEDGVTLGRDVNSKMRYVCALCNRIYTSKYSLERHVRCHTLEKPYHCDVCDFTSSYREHMMRHMTSVHLIVHSDAPKVKYTPKKKLNEEGTDLAQNDNAGSSPKKRRNILRERFECAVCGITATHKTDLMQHIRLKHPNAHIESLENKDGSKVHLIVTMAKKQRQTKRLTIHCTYCSLIFHDTWKYKVHLRSHTGVKPFQCSICNLKATSKMTVRDHIHRKHTQDENAKILIRTVGIDGSVEEVELPVPWREFKCEFCNSQFNDNYNLKLHKQKSHPEALPFLCILCNHKELTRAGMIIHCYMNHKVEDIDSIIMRNGKICKVGSLKLPTCDFCGKIFPYKSQLNMHTRFHTGEKSFSCDECGYKTNNKKHLVNHFLKKHTIPMGNNETPQKKAVVKKEKRGRKPKKST